MGKDFIPKNWSAFADWSDNYNTQLQVLAAKYGVSAAKLTQNGKDNDWVKYWVQAKFNGKQQEKQLGDYVDDMANGELNDPQPAEPTWALPADPPPAVPPGVKKRYREIAAFIKAQKSIYTEADGQLLGIIPPDEAGLSPDTAQPELKLRTLPNYGIETDFRKYGLAALRVEARKKGGDWELAATLTSSPGMFNIIPTNAGEAEQVEIRAIFQEKNQNFGVYSPIYTVVIQP